MKAGKPGRWAVGDGAYLQISRSGDRSTAAWIFRYQVGGRARTAGLGQYPYISLSDARERATEARRQIAKGVDPIDARREAKASAKVAAAKAITFKFAAEQYIKAHTPGWKNAKHAKWPATMAAYAYPTFGHLSIAAVDTPLVIKTLEPIWTKKPETASRVRSRIEAILDWARVRGFREGENPARWRGHLDKLLAKRGRVKGVRHHPAMPFAEVPKFISKLRERDSASARALEFTILTAARTSEVTGANWSEIAVKQNLWTIPASRMKAKKEHRVPLAARAIEILNTLQRRNSNPHLFAGSEAKPLSNMAMLELTRGMCAPYVPHGFRSSFRDWAAEKTAFPNHVVEQALAHAIGDKVEAAYRRGDLLEQRRQLMRDWASFCEGRGA